MKFNGIDYAELRGDNRTLAKPKPKLTAGMLIKVLYDDAEPCLPGCRVMKAGYYNVVNVRESYTGHGMVYELVKIRSKYVFAINTIAIDKAIIGGAIKA
jgi:hypothetical protein